MKDTGVRSLGPENPLEKEMATHSRILAWRVPWTEEPGGRVAKSQTDVVTKKHQILLKLGKLIHMKTVAHSESRIRNHCFQKESMDNLSQP